MSDPSQQADAALLPYLFNRLTAAINQRWLQQIRSYKLTIPRWQVLSVLAVMDGMRVGRLAQLCGAEQAVISRVVDQMVREDLVSKRTGSDDSRVVEVWLTARGREIHQTLLPAASALVQELLGDMPPDQAVHLSAQLQQMLSGFEQP